MASGVYIRKSTNKKTGALPNGALSNSYVAIHSWLNRQDPKPKECVKCHAEGYMIGQRWSIEHALKSGLEHERNLNNYESLCKSCHRRQDYDDTMRANWSKAWIRRKERGLDLKRDYQGRFLPKTYGYS